MLREILRGICFSVWEIVCMCGLAWFYPSLLESQELFFVVGGVVCLVSYAAFYFVFRVIRIVFFGEGGANG